MKMSSLVTVSETIAELIRTDSITKNIFKRYKDAGYLDILERLAIAQTKRAIDAEERLLEMIRKTPNFTVEVERVKNQ